MILNQSRNNGIRHLRDQVLQKNNTKHIIKQTQVLMQGLTENLLYEPFSNNVTPDDCVDRLVAHRIKSKFHIDDPLRANQLQSLAFSTYKTYDAGLSDEVIILPNSSLSKARANLHTWFKNFKVDFAKVRYRVSAGETYISSQGEVSILSKLFDRNHWTTTANCLDDTCTFIYNQPSFKRAAWQHIGRVTRRESRRLYMRFKHKTHIGFHVFRHLLITRVLILTDGARASSVPKSNEQRRFINVEAMFPVILQRAVSARFLAVLRSRGNDLSNFDVRYDHDIHGSVVIERSAQWLHGHMISSIRYSTIDFSNASDSVTIAAVRALFPNEVSDLLIKLRSHYVAIDGELVEPKKLSSMGNGFTFEVMTAMLYAIACTFTSDCRVYGDDVILPNEFATDFVDVCKLVDFRVNEKKTFINSFFRESCGYFYSDHLTDYITSFDFGQIKSMSDVIITTNKLTVILQSDQISHDLAVLLTDTRDRIAAEVHASRKGPLPVTHQMRLKYLSTYIYDEDYAKKQRRCKNNLVILRKHYIEKNSTFFSNCQTARSDYALIFVPFFVPKRSNHIFTSKDGIEVLLPALYSGKRLKATIKGKGKWIDLPAFVATDGTLTLISNLIGVQSTWKPLLDGVVLSHEKM